MSKSIVIATLALCMFLSTAVSAQIFNGSFEVEDPNAAPLIFNGSGFLTVFSGGSSIYGWSIGGHSVDYIDSTWTASNVSRSVDLNGTWYGTSGSSGGVDISKPAMGTISQTLSTIENLTYHVSFDMSGNPGGGPSEKTMTVSINDGLSPQLYNYIVGIDNTFDEMKWDLNKTYIFTATGNSTVLTFASTTNTPWGPVIDNVRITDVTGQVCHVPPGRPAQQKTLTVGVAAIPAHLAHGDTAGPCPVAP